MNGTKACQFSFWRPTFSVLIILTSLTCQIHYTGFAEEPNADNSTHKQPRIEILQHTLVITHIGNGLITVMELIQAQNQDATTQHQGDSPIILCSLPKEFLNLKLEPQSVGRLAENSGSLELLGLIKPSETQNFGFTYTIRLSETLDLSRRINCETVQLNTFIPEGIPLVPSTEFLSENQQERIHDQTYNIYTSSSAASLQPGQLADVRFQIRKPPSTSTIQNPKTETWLRILIAIAAAILGGFLVVIHFKIRVSPPHANQFLAQQNIADLNWLKKLNSKDLDQAKNARLELILHLDTIYEKEQISEKVYNRLRKEQTEKLDTILKKIRENT
ncbi:TPA: hypothetical protein EYN65_01370 [Candidatus Poribacteria bacterium]|nr:hypothetical protein [Candidatus Poribacteria bacterium]